MELQIVKKNCINYLEVFEKKNRLHVNHIIGIFSMSEQYHFAQPKVYYKPNYWKKKVL